MIKIGLSIYSALILSWILLMVILMATLIMPGCKFFDEEPSHILKRTDQYYSLIKAIVTDEEVYTLIPPETLEQLHEIDEAYKALRAIAKDIDESQDNIMAMAQCGLDVCDILSDLDIDGDNKEEIAAVRLSIKAFMATMLESEPNWYDEAP